MKPLRSIYLTTFLSLLCIPSLWALDGQRIVVMHTNDVHGGINPQKATFMSREFPPSLGGGASQATIIQAEREKAKENGWGFLLIDDGDIFQGTPVGTKTKGRAVIDYMNRVGYDLLTVGNHDFDKGVDNLRELAEMANFPFLGANVVNAETGEILSFLKPYLIKEVGGIKLGIIGLCTTETQQMSFPGNIKGVKFVIAGKKENLYEEVKERCKKYDNVEFLGTIPFNEVVPKTLEADAVICMINPSDLNNRIGLANKQFEAMVCGRPIITTRGTYSAKMTEKLKCGIVVDYNGDSLKKGIEKLRDNPKLCEELGRNALKAALEQYNWENEKRKLLKVYESLV